MFPENLSYTRSHEWIERDGDRLRVGITAYAQEELGDIVFVELSDAGNKVEKGDEIAVVESVKAVSEIYAPVGGEVAAVNDRLEDEPELINSDPYGEGFLCEIVPESPDEPVELLDSASYQEFLREEE